MGTGASVDKKNGSESRHLMCPEIKDDNKTKCHGWKVYIDEPNSFICRFCGGKSCKREDWTRQRGNGAIKGLHSNWVNGYILACQRPSERLIREFKLIEVFQKHDIRAIFNLQQSGEHPLCGDGINESGFSYYPETFMRNNIFFYAFGWVDFGCPTLEHMLNIAQVMQATKDGGKKLAVHCHAGLGRTGVAIASFLTFSEGISPLEAITMVRKNRPGALQTQKQCAFVHDFDSYVRGLRLVFPQVEAKSRPFTLHNLVERQATVLHGKEVLDLAKTAKIVKIGCDELEKRIEMKRHHVTRAFKFQGWTAGDEKNLYALKLQINRGDYSSLALVDESQICGLLVDFLCGLSEPIVPSHTVLKGSEINHKIDIAVVKDPCVNCTLKIIFKMLGKLLEGIEDKTGIVVPVLAIVGQAIFQLDLDSYYSGRRIETHRNQKWKSFSRKSKPELLSELVEDMMKQMLIRQSH